LELVQGIGVETSGISPVASISSRRFTASGAAEPGPMQSHLLSPRRERVGPRHLHGLEQAHLDHGRTTSGTADRHVAGIGAKGAAPARADRARQPGAPADEHRPRLYLLSSGRLRGTSESTSE
jgi:hypothetical protein